MEHAKKEDPKRWWKEVKRLCRAQSHSGNLKNSIQIDELNDVSTQQLAHVINTALLEPLEEYGLPHSLDQLSLAMLSKSNPTKASGPDEIPNWLLKEYARS